MRTKYAHAKPYVRKDIKTATVWFAEGKTLIYQTVLVKYWNQTVSVIRS